MGAKPPPFTPAGLPTVAFWGRSDSLVTTSGGRLTVWGNKLGGANTFVPGGTGPTYSASDAAYNGFPSFTHASGNGLTSTINIPYGPYTIFIAGRVDASLPGYLYFHSDLVSTDDTCAGSSTNSLGIVRTDASVFFNLPAGWANATTPKVYTSRFGGSQASALLRKNGVPIVLTPSVPGGPGITVCNGVFKFWGIGAKLMAGTTAEIIICTSALSDALVAQTEAYLISRYAIT